MTADTGGHIRYLLDLVEALERHPAVHRQTIVTRGFVELSLGAEYMRPRETLSALTTIVRIFGRHTEYLSKEDLYRDVPALSEAFLEYLAAEPSRPDVVHAHYADAGTLAAAAKARFGVPTIFTAHSLGAMKRMTMGASAAGVADLARCLARREAVEDEAIAAADLIVASTRDEAEGQLPAYPSARADKIRINPPGCSMEEFARPVEVSLAAAVAARIDATLARPELPPILALARPVWRKNLTGLVEAYACDRTLQDRANLVIFAGASHRAQMLSCENRAVLARLFELVAEHRLEGRVSLPSHHRPDEVPAIYGYAASRCGVFANPALHEPFGLTLIEAAAAGLPVVATNLGGPRDILADCRHGLLADPNDRNAIAAALRRLMTDAVERRSFAAAGASNVAHYTWARHADLYVRTARALRGTPTPMLERSAVHGLLLSDIDGTMTGSHDGLAQLERWRQRHPKVAFGVATGRSLHDAIGVLSREGVTAPGVLVTSLGSEIYYTTDEDYGVLADEDWDNRLAQDWDPNGIDRFLSEDARLVPQPAMEQRRFKRSWFARLSPRQVKRIADRLDRVGLQARVVYSHRRYLDVLPRGASKGKALAYLRDRLGLARPMTAAAGDAGNDRCLLREAGLGIVVANHERALSDLRGLPSIVFSRESFAAGVVAGLAGWPTRQSTAMPPRHVPLAADVTDRA